MIKRVRVNVETFDFAGFEQLCTSDYAPAALKPQKRLEDLHRHCEALLARFQPERVEVLDCRAGCGTCCVVNVAVLIPEALAIVEYVESHPLRFARLETDLDRIWHQVRGVADDERVCMRVSCVFLDEAGSCSIYPVRPLLCRGVTSTSAEDCRRSFNANLFNEKISVRMSLFQRELYDRAFVGLSEGLEACQRDGRSFEMTGIIRHLLRKPQRRTAVQSGYRLAWEELA